MKKIICVLISFSILLSSAYTIVAAEDNGNVYLYDDCADFSKVLAYSEGLALDVVTEDNKYAFSGDDTHIIRVTSDAEWMEYEVNPGGYFVFNTCFSPSESVSDFTFEYSEDGEAWKSFNPIITRSAAEAYKWLPVSYSLKKLPETARYIRVTFQNIGGIPWSPCLESVEIRPYSTNEQGFSDCIGTKYYKPASKLKNLGLVSGYSANEFNPSGSINRAEFCSMTAKLLGINTLINPDSFEKIFNDIESDYWGAGAIYAMYALGVINGDENGNFNPDDNIILQDAVKIIVSVLGYQTIAEESGGYPSGYITSANRLKLLRNIEEVKLSDNLIRGDAAVLMDNALDAEIMHQTVYGGQNFYTTDGENVLTKYHDIYEKHGVVTDVGYSSVYSEQTAAENEITVGGERIKTGGLNLIDYLGMKVAVYAKYNPSDRTYTAVYLEIDDENRITEIDYNSYDHMENGSLYYTDESGREQRVSLHDNTKIIYNYKYDTRAALIDKLDFKAGYLKVISNGENGSAADYVIITDFDTYFVPNGARLGGTFSDKYKGAVNLGLDSADLIMLKNDGEDIEYSEDYTFGSNVVLCVAKSRDGQIADIRISVDTAAGHVESVNSAEGEYVIDGDTYKLSEYFKNTGSEIQPGSKTITAYLDINDNIVSMSEESHREEYGYLQAVSEDGGAFSDGALLRIINESGKAIEIKANGKSELNGKSSSINSFLNLSPQLVRYTLRSSGSLAALDTAVDTSGIIDEQAFTKNYSGSALKYYGDGLNIFASKYQLTADTKVFVLPNDEEEISKYEVTDLNRLMSDTAYDVELYDVNESYRAGAAVIRLATDEGDLYNYSPFGVVIDSGTSINSDGDKYLSVKLYLSDGTESELKFSQDGATDRTDYWIDGYRPRNTVNGNNPFSAGEVIQFSVKNDECAAFRVLLSAEQLKDNLFYERNLGDYGALSEELFYSEMYSCFGSVERKFSDKIFICGNKKSGWIRSIPLSASNIYVYDRRNKKLTVGDASDIEQDGRIFVQMRFALPSVMMVIR